MPYKIKKLKLPVKTREYKKNPINIASASFLSTSFFNLDMRMAYHWIWHGNKGLQKWPLKRKPYTKLNGCGFRAVPPLVTDLLFILPLSLVVAMPQAYCIRVPRGQVKCRHFPQRCSIHIGLRLHRTRLRRNVQRFSENMIFFPLLWWAPGLICFAYLLWERTWTSVLWIEGKRSLEPIAKKPGVCT